MSEPITPEEAILTNLTNVAKTDKHSPFLKTQSRLREAVGTTTPIETTQQEPIKPPTSEMLTKITEAEASKRQEPALFPGNKVEEEITQQIKELAPRISLEQKAASRGEMTPDQKAVAYDHELQLALKNMLDDRSTINIGRVEALREKYEQLVNDNRDNLSENTKKQFLNTWNTNQFPMPEGFEVGFLRKSPLERLKQGISNLFKRK